MSDLQRDGWWRGRVETDEHGHVYVAEDPTRPGEPQLGSTRTVMIRFAGDASATVADDGPCDVMVVQRDPHGEQNQEHEAPAPESLSAVLDRTVTARLVLVESQPELWDGLWRLGSGQGRYQRVQIEPRVPFAPEVIGAALLAWHDWEARQVNAYGGPGDVVEGWAASTVLVRVPTLAEWIPIHVTPISR